MILILVLLSTGDFTGTWNTTYGRMVLTREGDRVSGHYIYQGLSSIQGTVDRSGRLVFTYVEPDAEGEGWFEILDDRRISGMWRPLGGTVWMPWEGYRHGEEDGGRWLVILEAPWEEFLDEPHYSFGSMLAEWFRRVSGVRVRHRWFSSESDLKNLFIQASMLSGQLFLVVSSHGTPGGISSAQGLIPLSTVVECIETVAGNAALVHFSSCGVLGGDLPGMLEDLDAPVFVSGYDREVSWSGSGIIEIYYLNLILDSGLDPERAAETLLSSISFAGTKPGVHDEAAGFTWVGGTGRGE